MSAEVKLPNISVQELLANGVHFGHQASRWNPKMSSYIYRVYNGVHIIDLLQTVGCLGRALEALFHTVKNGGRILFVGTKVQAKDPIRHAAQRCGQYYINQRWLGGTLTNWKTVSQSIGRLRELEERINSPQFAAYHKKEQLGFQRQCDKLRLFLDGIRDMGGLPDMVFILDTNKELNAVRESLQLKIPVVAVLDTNSNPDGINYPIPGNDDALKSIQFYCDIVAQTVLLGLQAEMGRQGVDLGTQAEVSAPEDLAQAFKEASTASTPVQPA